MRLFTNFLLALLFALPVDAAFAEELQPVTPPPMTGWTMFLNADWVVKLVMLLLVAASIATWAIWAAKVAEFRKARGRLTRDLKRLETAQSLDDLRNLSSEPAADMVAAATAETENSTDLAHTHIAESVRERISIRFGMIEARVLQAKQAGLSVLGSIGATAPFVGLFGTVWGIMNSFIGISKAQTTNLAVVAPGIAEALLATAFGLVAAVPAVLVYNFLARSSVTYRRQLREASAQIACLLSRDIEREQGNHR